MTAIAQNIKNTNDFFNYLTSLDLFRWSIKETENGFEAILSDSKKPNVKNFTQIKKEKDGTFWVRLSKKDIEQNIN